jgi:predicted ATPase
VLISPVLVGRGEELDVLARTFERAATGDPAIVLVGGEAGVGKTRLIEEAAARAVASGVRVLTGACAELGGGAVPLAPLVDIVRTLAPSTPEDELDALLGPARSGLGRLLPELDPVAQSEPTVEGAQASRLFELVLGVVGRLAAEQPLGLLIEDLHWADRSTVDLIAFLVPAMRDVPVTVVATYRSDELHRNGHLEDSADVGRAGLVEKGRAGVRVAVEGGAPITLPIEELECDECVGEVGNRPRVKPERLADLRS